MEAYPDHKMWSKAPFNRNDFREWAQEHVQKTRDAMHKDTNTLINQMALAGEHRSAELLSVQSRHVSNLHGKIDSVHTKVDDCNATMQAMRAEIQSLRQALQAAVTAQSPAAENGVCRVPALYSGPIRPMMPANVFGGGPQAAAATLFRPLRWFQPLLRFQPSFQDHPMNMWSLPIPQPAAPRCRSTPTSWALWEAGCLLCTAAPFVLCVRTKFQPCPPGTATLPLRNLQSGGAGEPGITHLPEMWSKQLEDIWFHQG